VEGSLDLIRSRFSPSYCTLDLSVMCSSTAVWEDSRIPMFNMEDLNSRCVPIDDDAVGLMNDDEIDDNYEGMVVSSSAMMYE